MTAGLSLAALLSLFYIQHSKYPLRLNSEVRLVEKRDIDIKPIEKPSIRFTSVPKEVQFDTLKHPPEKSGHLTNDYDDANETLQLNEVAGKTKDKIIDSEIGKEMEKPLSETITKERNSAQVTDFVINMRTKRVVFVKEGDCLSDIIIQVYGSYDDAKLQAFLRENPEIDNPNLLQVGQALILPLPADN